MENETPVNGPAQAVVAPKKVIKPRSFPGLIGNANRYCAILESLGATYNPANPRLALPKLIDKTKSMSDDHYAVIDLVLPNKEAIILCHNAFKAMSPFKTRLLNTLKASQNVTKAQVLISINLGKKVDGIRIKALKKTPAGLTPEELEVLLDSLKNNTVSHQQMEVLISSFYAFISYTLGLECYKTTEIDLQMPAVKEYYDSLTLLMHDSQKTSSDIDIAREKRDVNCFDEVTGGVHAFDQSKFYILGKFKSKSKEYKLVKGIAFYDLRKKADK